MLGCVLIHETKVGITAGRIVETEAYDETDPASHSWRGPTPRTRLMFGPAGFAYVYFSYGAHWCTNVVAGPDGHGAAVLLRALEPLCRIEIMAARRGLDPERERRLLCRGPGLLTRSMCLTGPHHGADLCAPPMFVTRPPQRARFAVEVGPRIGIRKAVAVPWRFHIAHHPYVSR